MSIQLFSEILDILGALMIAFTVIRVHGHVLKEHRIDKDVLDSIRGEKRYAIVGIVFITISFILDVIAL